MRLLDLLDDGLVFLLDRPIDLVVLVLARDRHVGRDLDDLEVVDLLELVGLGRGRAGHAGELLVEAEIVLEGDRGEGLVLGLDLHPLLRLQPLVQPFRIAPARHHAAGELVDDHDLAVPDDVVLVALEQRVGAQRLVDVVDDRRVVGVVEAALLEGAGLAQHLLHALVAGLGQRHRALLLVEVVMRAVEARDQLVDRDVEVGAVVDRPRDDQRRARLVDQDRVDLVDDAVVVPALHHVGELVLHVVAQIVEAVLVVRAVGDVAVVGGLALVVVEPVHDHADRHAEELVDLPHPVGVAAGQVVVHRDDVHALAGERVEIDRKRRDERLAFAGLHLGDAALVQHHAADELDVEMALAERALRRLAHGREGLDQDIVELLAGSQLGPEALGAGAQLVVGKPLHLGLDRVDCLDAGSIALDPAVVGGAENLLRESA